MCIVRERERGGGGNGCGARERRKARNFQWIIIAAISMLLMWMFDRGTSSRGFVRSCESICYVYIYRVLRGELESAICCLAIRCQCLLREWGV